MRVITFNANGIRAAVAAGLITVVIPNRAYPPDPAAVVLAHAVESHLDTLTEDDIRQNFVVTQEQKYEDGVLMRIDKPLDKPAAASTHPS